MKTTTVAIKNVTQKTEGKPQATQPQNKRFISFASLVEETVDLPHHEVSFVTGKEIRDRSDRFVLEAYMKSKITMD